MVDDLDLLAAWAEGDRAAAGELLDRYLEPVARFFRGKVRGDVDDYVQETFTRCLARRATLASGSSFRAYVFAVARNYLYENFRKDSKHVPLDPSRSSLADLAPTPSSIIARAREQQLMHDALRHIPVDSQAALELYYWEGLSVNELADVFEVPPGTVKSRLHRARAQLRAALEQMNPIDPALAESLSRIDAWEREAPRREPR